MQQLQRICNTANLTEIVPYDWQLGMIGPIIRKREKSACDSYRRITLLVHSRKIYSRILEKD